MYYREISDKLSVFIEYNHFAKDIEKVNAGFISAKSVVHIFAVISRDFSIQDMRDLAFATSQGYQNCNLLAEILRRSNIIDLGYYYPDNSNYKAYRNQWCTEIKEIHTDKFWELVALENNISCSSLQKQRKLFYEENKEMFFFHHSKRIRSNMSLEDLINLADS